MLNEKTVEKHVRKYLKERGWNLTNEPKTPSEHGVDILAFHPKWRRRMIIEAKGETKSHSEQTKHNGFNNIIGQILSRMDIKGNSPKKARIYALAIPESWEKTFKQKIKNMEFGWKLLKLKVFLVKSNGEVREESYSHFLKKEGN